MLLPLHFPHLSPRLSFLSPLELSGVSPLLPSPASRLVSCPHPTAQKPRALFIHTFHLAAPPDPQHPAGFTLPAETSGLLTLAQRIRPSSASLGSKCFPPAPLPDQSQRLPTKSQQPAPLQSCPGDLGHSSQAPQGPGPHFQPCPEAYFLLGK